MFCYYKPDQRKRQFFKVAHSKSFDNSISKLFPRELPSSLISEVVPSSSMRSTINNPLKNAGKLKEIELRKSQMKKQNTYKRSISDIKCYYSFVRQANDTSFKFNSSSNINYEQLL